MKLIVAGSRDLVIDGSFVRDAVLLAVERGELSTPTEIVSGASGLVDLAGEQSSSLLGAGLKTFPADWEKHGRAAGPIRNRQMASYADELLLIWDGKSRGSASMKREAKKVGLRICEIII